MKRLKTRGAVVVASLGLVCLLALRFYAIVEPQTAVGDALFMASYKWSAHKKAVLDGYEANLIAYNGGYIPAQADAFLCSRLRDSPSKQEFIAVTDFYVGQAGARRGFCIFSLPSQTKQRITGEIIRQLGKATAPQAEQAMILMDGIWRGQAPGKAIFVSTQGKAEALPEYDVWLEKQALPTAKAHFRKWWADYPSWEEKEKHDPLEGTGLEISDPLGF